MEHFRDFDHRNNEKRGILQSQSELCKIFLYIRLFWFKNDYFSIPLAASLAHTPSSFSFPWSLELHNIVCVCRASKAEME
jgi:hypothetical protein